MVLRFQTSLALLETSGWPLLIKSDGGVESTITGDKSKCISTWKSRFEIRASIETRPIVP